MNKCLNCEKPIEQKEGRRPRLYCDNKGYCRLQYWNKNNPKEPKYVLKRTHDNTIAELQKKIEELSSIPQEVVDNVINDVFELNVAIVETDGKEVKHIDPTSDEGEAILDEFTEVKERIVKIKEQLALSHKFVPFAKRRSLEKELAELENKIK